MSNLTYIKWCEGSNYYSEIVLPVHQPNSNLQIRALHLVIPGKVSENQNKKNNLNLLHPISSANYIAYVLCV